MTKIKERLAPLTKLAYGVGDFGFAFADTAIGVLFAIFLTDVVGLRPSLAALAIFNGKSWDYVNDPIIGYIVDRTRTRWGRRRPYLLFGFVPARTECSPYLPRRTRTGQQARKSAHPPGRVEGAEGRQPSLEGEAARPGVRLAVLTALCYWVLIHMVPPMLLAFLVPITDRYLFLPSVGLCLLLAELAAGLEHRLKTARQAARRGLSPAISTGPLTPSLSPSEGERVRAGEGKADASPTVPAPAGLTLLSPQGLPWAALAVVAVVWGAKTWAYIGEWRDPRSVWYGAHLKTSNSQVRQFLGEVYQNAGDRADGFVKSGNPHQVTNDLPLARAVLGDGPLLERLRVEWTGAASARTNSIAYRDQLWDLAWQQYEDSLARRGTLSTPDRRGFQPR